MIFQSISIHHSNYLLMIACYIGLFPAERTLHHFRMTLIDFLNGQLKFNITKCVLLRCTRSLSPYQYNYILNNHTLAVTDQHTYLGVLIDKRLSWSPHISNIASKASQTLNFLKRNLSKCSTEIKASAYLTMVRPLMEYASAIWDPCYIKDIQQLEKVRRSARWVLNDYSYMSSVTSILQQLSWPTLKMRRKISRIIIFIKLYIINYHSLFHLTIYH